VEWIKNQEVICVIMEFQVWQMSQEVIYINLIKYLSTIYGNSSGRYSSFIFSIIK
jgi:hypothetical protein